MNKTSSKKQDVRDERASSILAPLYRKGFYIFAIGILFDLYTRFNYLAQTGGNGSMLHDPIELAVFLIAMFFVGIAKARSGIFSDSMRVLEAQSFKETGMIQKGIALAGIISIAAVGGRVYNEIRIFGWGSVTWASDIAILVILLVMFSAMILVFLYLGWRGYRRNEARLSEDD